MRMKISAEMVLNKQEKKQLAAYQRRLQKQREYNRRYLQTERGRERNLIASKKYYAKKRSQDVGDS